MYYGNNFNPYPYQNQFNYPQQAQRQNVPTQQVINGLAGRIVEDVSNVNANEIPMDGSKAVFLKADGSEIYTKQWQSDGTIRTRQFKAIENLEPSNSTLSTQKSEFDTIYERLGVIESGLLEVKDLMKTKKGGNNANEHRRSNVSKSVEKSTDEE